MLTFSEALHQWTDEYVDRKSEKYKENKFANFVRSTIPQIVKTAIPEPFWVKASVGLDKWTYVPWLGFFHPLETISAQTGFYVVYLVNASDRTLSLSLNQGVKGVETYVGGTGKKAHRLLETRAEILRQRAKQRSQRLSFETINLGDDIGPGRNYEAGHAFGRTYRIDELTNENLIKDDLSEMLVLYQHLINEGGYTILEDSSEKKGASAVETKKKSLHDRYDRFGASSKKVKELNGFVCEACKFDFRKTYGDLGKDYIEAHHLKPFSDLEVDTFRTVDLEHDFAVLCSNCHRMIHRQADPSDIEKLRQTLKSNNR